MLDLNLTANILGILSLLSATIAFLPCLIGAIKNKTKQQKILLKTAKIGLIITVGLALTHGLLMTQLDNLDFYSISTYWAYAVGLFAFNVLIFLTFNYSELKCDRQKLNYFSYGALFLLIFHVGQQIIPGF